MAKKIFRCGPIMTLFSTQRNINYFRTNNGNPFALKSVLNYFKIDTHKLPLKCCARFPQTIQFSSNDRNEQCLVSISVVQCSENESSDFAATAGSHSSRKCTAIFHELRLPTPTKAFAPFSQECFGQRTTPSPAAIQRTTPHPGRTTARQGMTTTRPKTTTRPRTTTKPVQSAKLVSVSPAGKTTPRGSPVKPAVVASPVVAVAGKAQTTRTTPKSNVKATTPARAVAVSVRTTSRQLTTIRTTLRTTPKNSKLVDARGTTQRTTTKTPTYSPTKLRSGVLMTTTRPPARPITTTMTNHPAGRTSTTSKPISTVPIVHTSIGMPATRSTYGSPFGAISNFGSLFPPMGNLTIPEPVVTEPPVTTTTTNVTDSSPNPNLGTTPTALLETSESTTTDSSITTTTTTITAPEYELDGWMSTNDEDEESPAEATGIDGTGPTRKKLKRRIRVNPETGQRQVMKRRKVVKAAAGEVADEVEVAQ
ncbi:mucin-2 isoform X2 [Aedes albopictus]|uniref:Uncharacterized protein n=1 Tax=Aedes albopictus TaxID=7160 RepID=A0ABM1YDV0_AEDAL